MDDNIEKIYITPQDGFQMNFLASPADIVIGGGAAGVGKTFVLLLEFLRHINNKKWGGVIFRRTSPQIKLEGGLWDTSSTLYPSVGAVPRESTLEWIFPEKSKLKFSHLEYEKNIQDWQGSQIPFIGFDELTHFSEKMFFYLLTRSRSTCGIKPYIRCTCNPDPESWVAKLIEWWIDQETGFPIPERDGVLRYFIKAGENYIWGNTKQEVLKAASHIIDKMVEESKGKIAPEEFVKSITFISGSIYQNVKLLEVNPSYLANLLSQDEASKRSLLDGNWKFVSSDKDIYDYSSFNGMFVNKYEVKTDNRRIIADIALEGSDKFIISYFEGRSLEDIDIIPKSNGPEVVNAITKMAVKHQVPNNKILFDADGVGGFVGGFLEGAIPFHGGGSCLLVYDEVLQKNIKENYFNLKTQLIYRSGKAVEDGKARVSEYVANKMYDANMTIRQRMIHERKAFKKANKGDDGKLKVISKAEMKVILQGESPDVMDTFFMNEYFEIKLQRQTIAMTAEEAKKLDY